MGNSRFGQLLASRDRVRAIEQAILFLTRARQQNVRPLDLLRLRDLQAAVKASTTIDGCLPVNRSLLQGYVSWLGQWRSGGRPFIAIDASLYSSIRLGNPPGGARRAGAVVLGVVAHEVGHEVMRLPDQPRQFVTDMGAFLGARPESLLSEARAWLFAGMLRAFLFADVGSEKRPDMTASLI